MSDDWTPEKHLAEVALSALSEGLHAISHGNQLYDLRGLREQVDLLSKWAIAHNDPMGGYSERLSWLCGCSTTGRLPGL
jgi:hypothetical protein